MTSGDLIEAIRGRAGQMGPRVIAAEPGVNHSAVYRAADKAGIPIRGRVQEIHTVRRVAEDIRPLDALEYVLEA